LLRTYLPPPKRLVLDEVLRAANSDRRIRVVTAGEIAAELLK
jgi:hypothetical protein